VFVVGNAEVVLPPDGEQGVPVATGRAGAKVVEDCGQAWVRET
jgi:hypothetical protein